MKIDSKYLRALSTSLLCTLTVGAVMMAFQWFSNNADEERLADRLLSDIPAQLDKESAKRSELIKRYDAEFFTDLTTLKFLVETGGVDNVFNRLRSDTLSSIVYLVRPNGVITHSTVADNRSRLLSDVAPLSSDDCRHLLLNHDDAVSSLLVGSDGSLLKCFATSFGSSRLVMVARLKGKYASVYSLEDLQGLFGPVDERLFVAPIDNKTLKIEFLRVVDGDFSNKSISDINLDVSATQQPSSGHSRAFGYGYRYKTVQYKSNVLGDHTILAFYTDMGAVPPGPLAMLLVAIFVVTFIVRLYCLYIDEEPGKLQLRAANLRSLGRLRLSLDTEKARSILPFALVCIVVVTLSGFYFTSIYMVANQIWTSQWNISQVSESLGKLDKASSDNFLAETEGISDFMQLSSALLEERQGSLLAPHDRSCLKKVSDDGGDRIVQIRNPWLASLAASNSACDISIFDAHGRLLVTSGNQRNLAFSRNDSASAPAFDIINGVADARQFLDDNFLYVCVPFSLQEPDAASDAILAVRYPKNLFQANSMGASISSTFDAASESGHCLYMMTSGSDDHRVVYAAESLLKGGITLPDVAFCDGYLGFHRVNETNYFVAAKRVKGHKGDYFIFSFVPLADVFIGRSANTLSIFVVTLLTLVVLLAILLLYGAASSARLLRQADDEIEQRRSLSSVQLEKLKVDIKKSPSASQRILASIRVFWVAVLCFASVLLVVGLSSSPNESFAGYLMSFSWQRGINIFSVSSMFLIVLSFAFVLLVLSRLMSVLGKALNASVETACQLLVSLLRYSGYIAAVFVTLYMFGVDTTGVLASLGAFSVMVGLGAQSLIKDVLAGISIIMEKDYRVGDIVEINGFCGKVVEIGIRTTKVEDIEGNVKIFYNSNVSGVVNMTRHLSAVRLELKVDASHPFDLIERTLEQFFASIEGKYPQIKGKCAYLGIQDSSPSFNVFLFSVPCDEIDRVPLRRILLKDLSEFCKSVNIVKL